MSRGASDSVTQTSPRPLLPASSQPESPRPPLLFHSLEPLPILPLVLGEPRLQLGAELGDALSPRASGTVPA